MALVGWLVALLLGMPLFTAFGALSDKIGRKKIMMAGCLLAVLAYYPIYGAMQHAAGNTNAGCNQTPYTTTLGSTANKSGPYNDTCNGLPSGNGSGGGCRAGGKTCWPS